MGNIIVKDNQILNTETELGKFIHRWALNDYNLKKKACCTMQPIVGINIAGVNNLTSATKIEQFKVNILPFNDINGKPSNALSVINQENCSLDVSGVKQSFYPSNINNKCANIDINNIPSTVASNSAPKSTTLYSAPKFSTLYSAPKSSTSNSAPKFSTSNSAPKSSTSSSAPEPASNMPVIICCSVICCVIVIIILVSVSSRQSSNKRRK